MNQQTAQSLFIDISVNLSANTPVWPGAPRFQLEQKKVELSGGVMATSSFFSTIPHCGTHIDAPLHFILGGKTIDLVNLDLLIGRCRVIAYEGDGHIAKNDLDLMGFVPSKRLLIKTKNSRSLRAGTLGEDFISLLPDAMEHLMQSGVELLGVDGLSIGPYGELSDRNHVMFCGAGGIIIEEDVSAIFR
jgi:arylformamidase